MKLFDKHVIFDEITYDREELEAFVNRFKNCVTNHSKWQQTLYGNLSGGYGVPTGYNVIDTRLLEGKSPTDYPEVRNLLDKFKNLNILDRHVVISHYDIGFKLRPHTDHACQASIMFPILPKDAGAELVFHDIDPPYKPAQDYKDYWDKIDYTMKYSTQHPTSFSTQVPHSVAEIQGEPRIYLKFMLFNYTYEQMIEMNQQGRLF